MVPCLVQYRARWSNLIAVSILCDDRPECCERAVSGLCAGHRSPGLLNRKAPLARGAKTTAVRWFQSTSNIRMHAKDLHNLCSVAVHIGMNPFQLVRRQNKCVEDCVEYWWVSEVWLLNWDFRFGWYIHPEPRALNCVWNNVQRFPPTYPKPRCAPTLLMDMMKRICTPRWNGTKMLCTDNYSYDERLLLFAQ